MTCKHKIDKGDNRCGIKGCNIAQQALDLINRQQAEIERLQKLQKPTETSGFKIENGKVVFYTNILNGYRHEYKDLEEIAKELNLMLQSCYKCDEVVSPYKGNLKTAKTEAIKEFAERLCEGRVSNDPVVIAVKTEFKLTEQSTGYGASKTEGNG